MRDYPAPDSNLIFSIAWYLLYLPAECYKRHVNQILSDLIRIQFVVFLFLSLTLDSWTSSLSHKSSKRHLGLSGCLLLPFSVFHFEMHMSSFHWSPVHNFSVLNSSVECFISLPVFANLVKQHRLTVVLGTFLSLNFCTQK